jgi:hypothetical protein
MKMGYQAAQQYPDVLDKLFCYCGCDVTDKHNSLLDCYLTSHGAYCAICLEEAIEARQMKNGGSSIAQIQQRIDDRFIKQYPMKQPSMLLIKYRESLKTAGVRLTALPRKGANGAQSQRNPGHGCCAHNK